VKDFDMSAPSWPGFAAAVGDFEQLLAECLR
jgi:hypothetical protein